MRWLLLLIPLTLFATETHIQSKHIALKDKTLTLDGQVRLDNAMGTVHADHAKLQKTSGDHISEAFLKNNVLLELPGSATIACESASLNFTTLLGSLVGESRRVIYTDTIPGANQDAPLEISCHNVRFKMGKSQGNSVDIQHLTARNEVNVRYTENFSLSADYALYRKLDSKPCPDANIPQGMIKLYPKNASKKCLLSHHNDRVEADHISIDTKRSQIAMTCPKGILETRELIMTNFEAGQLVWDHKSSSLLMRDNVTIDDPLFGILKAENEMHIRQRQFDGRYYISTIVAQGPFTFHYPDAKRGPHTFYSNGNTVLDKDRLTFTATALSDKQITRYTHGPYKICAAKTHFTYSIIGHKPTVNRIDFEGDVCLSIADEQQGQLAVADYITYYPEKSEITLSANPESRVLYSRENDSIRLSADELTIGNTGATPSVHGVGRVKAFFDQDETNYYREIFKKRRVYDETSTPSK